MIVVVPRAEHRRRSAAAPDVHGQTVTSQTGCGVESEAALLRRAAQGDDHAFGQIYEAQRRRLYRLAYGVLLDPHDAREAVQEAFLALHRALPSCDTYKSFAKRFFPNARLVADQFHVLRLLNPALTRRRGEVTGDRRSMELRRLLLRNGFTLDFWQRRDMHAFLDAHPALREVYLAKEALHRFYRTRGIARAGRALDRLLDGIASSLLPELQTLRRTLRRWRHEVLAHFDTGLTNAMTEGFNLKAKLVKRGAFGYRSFRNYRLRLLNACA